MSARTHNTLGLLLIALLVLLLSACDSSVPPGRIRVKNDLWGEVDSTLIVRAAGSSYTLTHGQFVILPKGTTSIVISYTHSKKGTHEYGIQCPANIERGVTIKLIDVYMNKIAGGCEKVSSEQK